MEKNKLTNERYIYLDLSNPIFSSAKTDKAYLRRRLFLFLGLKFKWVINVVAKVSAAFNNLFSLQSCCQSDIKLEIGLL
jgi:hypothetical protein